MFNYGNQTPSYGNEKTANQVIIELQDKNTKLRLGLGKLLELCENTGMQNESEVWMQRIGFAKQMFIETDPNK